ncbi:tautomerase family protein [Phormidesmis sp. 146-33]
MAQIKIYGSSDFLSQNRTLISDAIHSCVVEALAFSVEKRAHRFILLKPEDFIYFSTRTHQHIVIEISLFEGRTVETKKKLIHLLFDRLSSQVKIDPIDVEITLTETPKHNWGIRGKTGDELALNYTVEL